MENKYLEFIINNEIKTVQMVENIAILLGDNLSGKSKILNTIYKGFLGKNSKFYYDNNKINFSDYQVLYFSEYVDISDEVKLTKTSQLRNKLIKNLNEIILTNSIFSNINDEINDLKDKLFNLINDKSFLNKLSNSNFLSNLKLKANLSAIDIEIIIEKLLKIDILNENNQNIESNKYSQWFIRMLFFDILLQYLDLNDDKRKIVLILDLPELYGTIKSKYIFINFLKKLIKKYNCLLIFNCNDSIFIELFKPNLNSINFVKNENIFFIKNNDNVLKNGITLYSYLKSEYNDYDWYKNQISIILNDEDMIAEIDFFNKNCLNFLFISLLFEDINLFYDNNNIYYEIIDEKVINLYLDEKRLIYIFWFLKYYNKNVFANIKNKEEFNKIDWIL